MVVILEFFLDIFLCLTELRAVCFVKDKNHLLGIYRQVVFALDQVVELLDSGDDDLVVLLLQVLFQSLGIGRAIDTIRGKTLVFLHGLIVQVLAIYHEKDLIYKVQFGSQPRRLEAGEGLS